MSTHLTVSFSEKDQVKALGARWDAVARHWFVPDGVDLAPFAAWLPAAQPAPARQAALLATAPTRTHRPAAAELAAQADAGPVGVPLSTYLETLSAVIRAQCAAPAWVVAEVSEINLKKGHLYLTLAELDGQGRLAARLSTVAFNVERRSWWQAFIAEVGSLPTVGMKLLVQVSARLDKVYGFSGEIQAIDASFVLGELAAKLKRILDRLRQEGLLDANRQLPQPVDYTRIAVVAPEGAAGLGDFMREAGALKDAGLIEIDLYPATFQGPTAAESISRALVAAAAGHAQHRIDAIVFLRGGGAQLDLDWLNAYEIGRAIAQAPVPVIVGVGHERDRTLPDEVACLSLDTPSKVSGLIRRTIVERATRAVSDAEKIGRSVHAKLLQAGTRLEAEQGRIERSLRAKAGEAGMRLEAAQQGLAQRSQARAARLHASLGQAGIALMTRAQARLAAAGQALERSRSTLEQRTLQRVSNAPHLIDWAYSRIEPMLRARLAKSGLELAQAHGELKALDPRRMLGQGFALVRDTDGRVVRTAAEAPAHVSIQWIDGKRSATVHS